MTKKRFESDGWKITDNETNEDIGMIKASELLNNLHEEKEFWKQQAEQYSNELEVYQHQKKVR